jgi:hypothetical protein
MINSVRTTVLAIANKNNFGYISPNDFNLYAKQAQLDLFEDYFYAYNAQIRKENARQSGTGYANITEGLAEVIDSFSVVETLSNAVGDVSNVYQVPNYYYINSLTRINGIEILNEIEKVSQSKYYALQVSNLTKPTEEYPVYVLDNNNITVYPNTIVGNGAVSCSYIRYPRDPKWTYIDIASGEPVFDATASDYQDFELPLSDEPSLVMKILQYAGVSIREKDLVAFGNNEELKEQQQEQ